MIRSLPARALTPRENDVILCVIGRFCPADLVGSREFDSVVVKGRTARTGAPPCGFCPVPPTDWRVAGDAERGAGW